MADAAGAWAANCPACAAVPVPIAKPIRGYRMVRCPDCGLQWWDFSSIDRIALYGPEYFRGANGDGYDDYFAEQAGVERTARRRLQRTREILGLGGGRVLDLGCGPGFFLNAARAEGWEVEGVELSESAADYARQTLHLPVVTAEIRPDVVPGSTFDLVTMWDVIEHLPDPLRALRAAAGALRSGGGLVLTTGDVDSVVARLSGERWHLYNLPEHFFFHTERSLRRLIGQAGLDVVAVRREPMVVSLQYAFGRVARSYFRGAGLRFGRWLPDILFPVTLHDVITVYARAA